MDISYFMTWFVSQFISMISHIFTILDSIKFAGTSLLQFCITIVIISALIPVILTIGKTSGVIAERSERIRSDSRKDETK